VHSRLSPPVRLAHLLQPFLQNVVVLDVQIGAPVCCVDEKSVKLLQRGKESEGERQREREREKDGIDQKEAI
jgi:hypothetical protein